MIGAGGVGQFWCRGSARGAYVIVAVDPWRRAWRSPAGRRDPRLRPDDLTRSRPRPRRLRPRLRRRRRSRHRGARARERAARRARNARRHAPAGARLDLDPAEFTNREKVLTGTVYGSGDPAEALPALLADVAAGRILLTPLVGPSFPLERAEEAIQAALAGEPGRVIVTP